VSQAGVTTFEKRGVMPDRKSLVVMLWLALSLALLASVLVAPVRMAALASVSTRLDCLRRNFAQPLGPSTTRLSAGMATDAALDLNALPSEDEEQDRADALDGPRVCFQIPCSFRNVLDRRLIAPCSILSLYPLRC
jgi:hypothetical protein